MSTLRNTSLAGPERVDLDAMVARHGVQPLTARSAVASTLLGVTPPRLHGRHLVEAGRLFGIAEGTTRVALSRMVASGEVRAIDGAYELAGRLLERQDRQEQSRVPRLKPWNGHWAMAVVPQGRRSAAARAELRSAGAALRLAELREGVWIRPDNLAADRLPVAAAVVAEQCQQFVSRPNGPVGDLAGQLWDLRAWAAEAGVLTEDMRQVIGRLETGDTKALGPAFMLGAAVLRHLLADPILPEPLLPDGWPGGELRNAYDRYLVVYQALWRDVFRSTA